MKDDLSLIVGERKISGWTAVRVSRSVERVPGDFDIGLTERYPGETEGLVVQPGDPCKVLLGDDLVITGYVDRYRPSVSAGMHGIRICGRGKCQDLVDCSAEWPGSQISGATALGIAKRLAKPYGITVSGKPGPEVPKFILSYGETAWEIVERVCRFAALLAIEQVDGNLLLTQVGTAEAGSGFVQGKNVEQADVELGMDQRYSEYWVCGMGANMYEDAGNNPMLIKKLIDPGVPRHRRKAIVIDAGPESIQQAIGIKRAIWEMNRRAARSRSIRVTVDAWRDANGKLWEPNTLAPIEIPALKLPAEKWVISEVSYQRDENGTHADVILMPADAFQPEPYYPFPFFPDVPFNIGAPTNG